MGCATHPLLLSTESPTASSLSPSQPLGQHLLQPLLFILLKPEKGNDDENQSQMGCFAQFSPNLLHWGPMVLAGFGFPGLQLLPKAVGAGFLYKLWQNMGLGGTGCSQPVVHPGVHLCSRGRFQGLRASPHVRARLMEVAPGSLSGWDIGDVTDHCLLSHHRAPRRISRVCMEPPQAVPSPISTP